MTEWINVVGLFTAPVIAVLITLWWGDRKKSREQKETVLQNFLNGWGRPADPVYTFAIRQIPFVFRKNAKVRRAYIDWFKTTNLPENRDMTEEEIDDMNKKQRVLLNEILLDLGFKDLTADNISYYTSRGLAERDRMLTDALNALPSIAKSANLSACSSYELVRLQTERTSENFGLSDQPSSK